MEFDYNICQLCEKEIVYNTDKVGLCRTGCTQYNISPTGKTVGIQLFRNKLHLYLLRVKENVDYQDKMIIEVNGGLQMFLKDIKYFKENNRYIAELLYGGELDD